MHTISLTLVGRRAQWLAGLMAQFVTWFCQQTHLPRRASETADRANCTMIRICWTNAVLRLLGKVSGMMQSGAGPSFLLIPAFRPARINCSGALAAGRIAVPPA